MAKGDDPLFLRSSEPDFDDQPRKQSVSGRQQFGLLNIMISLIYFAILFWAIRQYNVASSSLFQVIIGIIFGSGIVLVGLRLVGKYPRTLILGWMVVVIGYVVIAASSITLNFDTTGGWFTDENLRVVVTKSILILPPLVFLIGAIWYLSQFKRSNNQDALLGILDLSTERNMPLAPGVQAFAEQSLGVIQVRAETLAELLRRGIDLPEALDSLPALLPRSTRLLIRMGSLSGDLGRGLREASVARKLQLPLLRTVWSQLAYLAWVGCTGFFVTTFLAYFILPKFEAIFYDFGVELPEITKFLIRVTHVLVDYFWVPFLLGFGLAVAFVISYFGSGGMSVPLFDRLLRRRHSLLILRSLLLFIEAEQPIALAMSLLAHWYPTFWVRKKLAKASVDVGYGQDWIDALRSRGLLTGSDVGVLSSAQRAGNLAWAIRELIETSERRRGFRLQALMQLVFIGSMLIMGAIVFLIAVAYFTPLTTLIGKLSS